MKNLCLCVLLVVAVGCKKDSSGGDNALPSQFKPKLANVDTSKLKAPALFGYIPSDTPYVIASFEAVPLDYLSKMKKALGPSFDKTFKMLRTLDANSGKPSMLDAIITELDGKWNVAGLESLGFSASPRFAVYGLGFAPVVLRVEVKDDKAVLATIERVAKKAGQELPAMETKDNRSYWRFPSREADVIVALVDNQFVAAVGPAAEIDAKLPLILGIEKPPQTMADGKQLAEVMTKHGFGPYLVGFADTKRMITQGLAWKNVAITPACSTEIDGLAASVPRVVFGYAELSTARASGGAVIELSPDLVKQFEGLKAEVPGFGAAMAGEPLMAFGGGIDIVGAQKLAVSAVQALRRFGETCQAGPVASTAESMSRSIMRPLPDFVEKIHGGVFVVQSMTFSGSKRASPIPDAMDAFALLSAGDAKGLVEALMKQAPPLRQMGIESDGKLHKVGGGMLPVPFDVFAGVGDHAVVLAVGDKGKALAEKTIDASGGGKVPFLAASYDYGKFLELRAKMVGLGGGLDDDADQKMNDDLAKIFGRASVSLDITDKGLGMWGSIDMK
jgi:hypothetical protein